MSDEPGGSNFNKFPILLFDSSSAGAFVEKIDSSRANSKHVQAVETIVANLLSSGDVTYESLVSQIAIVTPYRPQTKRLVAALEKTIGDEVAKRIVTTVHRMQGNEKNYVILDLVDAPPEDIGFILSGNLLRDPGPRLLNVAVSRPRKQLLVIANFEHISGRAPTGHKRGLLRRPAPSCHLPTSRLHSLDLLKILATRAQGSRRLRLRGLSWDKFTS
jgi:superfamily I DNA and/or RNA helicase